MSKPTAFSQPFLSRILATRAQQLAETSSYTQETFSSLTQAPYMTRKAETKPFAQMHSVENISPAGAKRMPTLPDDLPHGDKFTL
jgi:hypothetical protein